MAGRDSIQSKGSVSDPVDESDPLPEYVPEARKEAEPVLQEIAISPEESAPQVEEAAQDKLEVERDARFLIEAMISRLEREDIEGALTYFAGSRKEQHRTVFQALKEKKVLKAAMKGYKGVHIESVYGHYAQCGVLREEPGGVYSYPVQLIKDADGRWKIYSF
ncbi:MAG: hypothetical protein Q8K68_13705 [Nitrospirota bacterium]|nr:hypothetical protein [Nitrospirota bacterium]